MEYRIPSLHVAEKLPKITSHRTNLKVTTYSRIGSRKIANFKFVAGKKMTCNEGQLYFEWKSCCITFFENISWTGSAIAYLPSVPGIVTLKALQVSWLRAITKFGCRPRCPKYIAHFKSGKNWPPKNVTQFTG